MAIKQIYNTLLKSYGKQGWWPIVNDKILLCEYHNNAPRNESDALEICFGAILTQNTNWKNVEKAIIQLNKNQLINIRKIIKINNKKLASIIKSSGYHNQKAIKLKNFCNYINKNYNGNLKRLFSNDIQVLRNELLVINGIGPETADSIILYAAKKPIFVIDAYTKRIMNRIGYKEETYDDLQNLFMNNLDKNEKLFNEYHALLVELGKNICKKEPLCNMCPINEMCEYHNEVYLIKTI